MQTASTKPASKMQEKRMKLIELSAQAKKLRQEFIDNARTPAEAAFWASKSINFMLLNYIYTEGGSTRFETFDGWKEQGATIRKGAKAILIWGQPQQAVATAQQDTASAEPKEDATAQEYEFFPICFLFSEDDVFFPNTEKADQEEQTQAATTTVAPPQIDSSAFDDL